MSDSSVFEFGPYQLDVEARAVTSDTRAIALAPKTFELLRLLVEHAGRALSKRDLMVSLWPDTFVEEANLSFQISALRKALGPEGARWIETVPKYGYRFVGDVRALPAEPRPGAGSPAVAVASRPPAPASPVTKWLVGATGTALVIASAYFVVSRLPHGGSPKRPGPRAVPLTSYPGMESMPALSPDGRHVAFIWNGPREDNWDVYVKLVGPGQPWRLTTDRAADHSPAWSPDGRVVAFCRRTSDDTSDILVVPAFGGAERKVVTVQHGPKPRPRGNLAWSGDGKWLAVGGRPSGEASSGVWLVTPDGGTRRRLTTIGDADARDTMPAFSPDGRYLAFVRARKSEANAIYAVPIAPETMPVGEPIRLMPDNWNVLGLAWASDGRSLIFSTGGHVGITRLQRLPFAVALAGRPVEPDVLPFGEHATAVSIAQTGRLVYASDTRDSNLWALPLAGPNRPVAPSPVAPSTYDDHTPDYSPDGKRLAFASNRSGDEEIWIADSDGSNAVQATSMKGPLCANPRWSPDGTRILFTSRREGSQDLYLLFPDTGDYRRITDDPAEEVEPRWSRDGRWIYFGSNRTGRPEVWKMPAGGGAAKRITQHGGLSASESPDGRFLYYAKNFSSPTSVWRVPVDGGEEALVVHGLSYSLNFVVAERGLYFLAVGDAPQKTAIMFFEYATGKTTSLFAVNKWWWLGMALSPDERTLMYSIVDGWGSDLMLVDRFQ